MSKIIYEKCLTKGDENYFGIRIMINPLGEKTKISDKEYSDIISEGINYKVIDPNNIICVFRVNGEFIMKNTDDKSKTKESSSTKVPTQQNPQSTKIEKVEAEIVDKKDIPGYQKIFSNEKTRDDYEDAVEILDPSIELMRFGPKNMKYKTVSGQPDTYLTNEQVSDLMHRVYIAVQPENVEQNRNINLVTAVILYISQSIKPELLFALCSTKEDMITVNSIDRFLTGFTIFTRYDCNRPMLAIADKTELFKIIVTVFSFFKEVERGGKFMCCTDIYAYLEDWMKLNFERNGTRIIPDYSIRIEEKPKIPFDFIIPGIGMPERRTPSKSTVNKIKTELSKISGGMKLEVVPTGDLCYATFFFKDHTNSYYIDPNVVIGNGFNIFCNMPIPGESILVNFKHKDIIKKAIDDPSYILSTDEIMRCQKDMFMNTAIYYRIDMSDSAKFIGKLSKEDFNKLGKKLSAVATMNYAQYGLPADPRLRINTFTSVDEFTLVSDTKTFSPLVDKHMTASQIVHGMELKIDHDDIYVYCPDPISGQLMTQEFTINYGVM